MAGATAYLGGIPFRTGPDQIRWDFSMKVHEQKTIGGKVIQILGVTVGDMKVTGMFGSGKDADHGNWDQMYRLRAQVARMVRKTEQDKANTSIEFVYAPRGWKFHVFIKSMTPVVIADTEIAPRWVLTFHLDEKASRQIAKDIEDLYIERLMDGVGWKQSDYNGPSEANLAEILAGRTVGEYLAEEAQKAFDSGLQGGAVGMDW